MGKKKEVECLLLIRMSKEKKGKRGRNWRRERLKLETAEMQSC